MPSLTYTLPSRSAATARGVVNSAAVAGPPSPANPCTPVPAIVVTMLVPVTVASSDVLPRSAAATAKPNAEP